MKLYYFCITVNIEDSDVQKKRQDVVTQKHTMQAPHVKEKRKDHDEKATDDYHYERFKKQFRRF